MKPSICYLLHDFSVTKVPIAHQSGKTSVELCLTFSWQGRLQMSLSPLYLQNRKVKIQEYYHLNNKVQFELKTVNKSEKITTMIPRLYTMPKNNTGES